MQASRYRIADACRLLDLQPYVLRYWLTEFPALSPERTAGRGSGFDDEDLAAIRRIKELLYDEGYTIADAKKKLAAELEDRRLGSRASSPAAEDRSDGERPAVEEPVEAVPESRAPAPSKDRSDLGALARRVERLQGGVTALASQARQLAAELQPETGAEESD